MRTCRSGTRVRRVQGPTVCAGGRLVNVTHPIVFAYLRTAYGGPSEEEPPSQADRIR
jgi:hypothetical protein